MAKLTLDRSPTEEAKAKAQLFNCAFIMLGHGKFALVDSDAYPTISQWTWHFNLRGYAARLQYRGVDKCDAIVYLHRFVKGDYPNVIYDHINRDKLDCRRINLRVATRTQNAGNAAKRQSKHIPTSRYKGVCFDSTKQRWLAQGRALGKMVFIGRYKDELEAAKAYDAWAIQHFGEFAYLNQAHSHSGLSEEIRNSLEALLK